MEPPPPLRVERAEPADLAAVMDILEDARQWLIRRGRKDLGGGFVVQRFERRVVPPAT